jgi:AraC-like DNA-binding protein
LLQQAGLSEELLHVPQARVSARQFGRLWHAIAQTLDDEFFGMDSHAMKHGSFTLMCHATLHSPTLERALLRAMRFLRLVLDDLVSELVRDGDTAHIVLKDQAPHRAFAYGTFLVILHGLACWLVGRRIPILSAGFRCDPPGYAAEWRVLFCQDLRFNQPECRLSFPASYLELGTVQDEASMKAFLREAPANFLVKYKNSASLSAQIRRQLRQWPASAWPDFATLARQLQLSTATLRRRLNEEGESYRAIQHDLRRDLAITLLSDTPSSLADIASELGFAESSAFHRAFKQWTGSRPSEYRQFSGFAKGKSQS